MKTPSISETAINSTGISFLNPTNYVNVETLSINGNTDLKSENLLAFDVGYREQFSNNFRLDIAVFINQYDNLLKYVDGGECNIGTGTATPPPREATICETSNNSMVSLDFPTKLANGLKAKTYGIEAVADWQATNWWRLQFNYNWFQMDITADANDAYTIRNEQDVESLNASHTANIRSMMNLSNQWYLDFWVRYMGAFRTSNTNINAYTALDVRLAKKINESLEFSLVGQNLFDKQRTEFNEVFSGLTSTQVQESWYAQIRWSF